MNFWRGSWIKVCDVDQLLEIVHHKARRSFFLKKSLWTLTKEEEELNPRNKVINTIFLKEIYYFQLDGAFVLRSEWDWKKKKEVRSILKPFANSLKLFFFHSLVKLYNKRRFSARDFSDAFSCSWIINSLTFSSSRRSIVDVEANGIITNEYLSTFNPLFLQFLDPHLGEFSLFAFLLMFSSMHARLLQTQSLELFFNTFVQPQRTWLTLIKRYNI